MKFLYLFFFMLTCVVIEVRNLKSPAYLRININDEPPSFDVSFPIVESDNEEDPVIGYKVKVIQVQKIKRTIHRIDNKTNEIKAIEVEKYPKIDVNKVPAGNYTELITAAGDNPKVTFFGTMPEVAYEITAFAFTKTQDGPPSAPTRFKINAIK